MNKAQKIRNILRKYLEKEMKEMSFEDLTQAEKGMEEGLGKYNDMLGVQDEDMVEIYGYLLEKGADNE